MLKPLLSLALFSFLSISSFAQFNNVYQPNGASTNFGKVAADSLNYYVVNYPSLEVVKIDPNNNATLLTTLTVDPFQTMIWNNGKGIFPVANGSPFKLFDGTNQIDIVGGQLPYAGYTSGKVILLDYFHKGNTTYFRTSDNIYKTDFSSPSSIITLATSQTLIGTGIIDMSHTTNSIIYQNIVLSGTGVIRRVDLRTGSVTTIDSSTVGISSYTKGIVYNDEYYYCTPLTISAFGNSKIYKVDDNGVKTVYYTETNNDKYIRAIIGGTANGIIAVIADNTGANEYVSISATGATSLNFGTFSNSSPSNEYSLGVSTSSKVYFLAMDTFRTIAVNKALWVTDGTLAGTRKIKGGSASTFNTSGLDQTFIGSVASCGDDIYYEGRDGNIDGTLIYVNGANYAMQALNYLPNILSIRKTSSGILAIAKPSYTLAAKAVYKINCSAVTSVNEEAKNQPTFDIFPNPSNGQFTISQPEGTSASTLTVYNVLGEVVHTEIITEPNTPINLNVSSGLYYVSLERNGEKGSKKILIN